MARERRSKKEVIISKMGIIDEKVSILEQKIDALNEEKSALQEQLDQIASAEKKAADEAQLKEVLKLIKSKNLSVEELRGIVESR